MRMTSLPSSSAVSSGGGLGLAAQHRPHPRHKHLGTEGLGHVVVGAEIQPADNVGFLALGGEHDDGHRLGPWLASQTLADGQPVEIGQHEVQEDQVGRLRGGGGQGLFARTHARHLVAFLQQVIADQLADVFLILDHQHGFFQHFSTTRGWFGQSTMSATQGRFPGFFQPLTLTSRMLNAC